MSAHSYIYVTIFYFLNYLFFKKKKFFFFLKMMLTYHISHEKKFSTALYVHGRSGVNVFIAIANVGSRNALYRICFNLCSAAPGCTRIAETHLTAAPGYNLKKIFQNV